MRSRRETTSLGQYTRGSVKTGRVHSAQAVNAMRAWYRQGGYVVQANATTYTVARGMRILACSDRQVYDLRRARRYTDIQCKLFVKEQSCNQPTTLGPFSQRAFCHPELALPGWAIFVQVIFWAFLERARSPVPKQYLSWALPMWARAGLWGAVNLSMWQPPT